MGIGDYIGNRRVGSTFENTRNLLEAAWGTCERWSQKTGMEFAPEKSELLHFSRAHADCELPLRLGAVTVRPTTDARFLGVWLNNRLSWKSKGKWRRRCWHSAS
jgi:hypothetical protein